MAPALAWPAHVAAPAPPTPTSARTAQPALTPQPTPQAPARTAQQATSQVSGVRVEPGEGGIAKDLLVFGDLPPTGTHHHQRALSNLWLDMSPAFLGLGKCCPARQKSMLHMPVRLAKYSSPPPLATLPAQPPFQYVLQTNASDTDHVFVTLLPTPPAATTGAFACTACLPGYFSYSGDSACQGCPKGWIAPTNGTAHCQQCAAGFYADSATAGTKCTACPAGYYSYAGEGGFVFKAQGTAQGGAVLVCSCCPAAVCRHQYALHQFAFASYIAQVSTPS
jgi:hypothetical protein